MAGDAEQLAIDIEARVQKLEEGMGKAQAIANKAYAAMKRSSASATAQMESDMQRSTSRINQLLAGTSTKIGSFGRAFVGGIGAGMVAALAPMALFQKALEAIADASHLVDVADKIGLSTKALQELGFGFSQAGVDAAEFETGMEQFSKRIGEAATRGGKLADILKANGIAIRDSNGQIKSSEELLRSYANLVKNAASEQEKMLLVTEAFGRGGGAMLVGLSDGAKGIDKMGQSARKAGVVIDDELLRRAEEMGDRWDEAWMRFKTSGNRAILEIASGLIGIGNQLAEFEKRKAAADLGSFAGSLVGKPGDVNTSPGKTGRASELDARIAGAFGGEIQNADEKIVDLLKKRYGEASEKATIIPDDSDKGGGKKSRTPRMRADDYERLSEMMAENIAATVAETEAQRQLNPLIDDYGYAAQKARMARELLTAAEKAGKEITPQLRAEIESLSEQYAMAGVEAAKLAEEQGKMLDDMEFRKDVWKGVMVDFRSALEDGKITFEELGDIAINVLDKIINKIEDDLLEAMFKLNNSGSGGGGGGLLGSLFGGLFGGGLNNTTNFTKDLGGGFAGLIGYANGGISDKPAIFGEGPMTEAAVPLPDGRRIPVDLRGAGGGGGQMAVTVDVGVSVDKNGNLQAFVTNIAQKEGMAAAAQTVEHYDRNYAGPRATKTIRDYFQAGGQLR